MNTPHSVLTDLRDCSEARLFCNGHPDLETAWLKCERADWLLWFAARRGVKRETLVLIACECAREVLPIFEKRYPDDKRVRECIETAERWARGEATTEEVRKARSAADAAYAADAADAAAAARTQMRARCAAIVRKHIPTLP